jgi:MtrB/PioB family decaheme-associated outer membrane protein
MNAKRLFASLSAWALLLAVFPAAVAAQGMVFTLDTLVLQALETDVDTRSSKFQEYEDLSTGFNMPLLRLFGRDLEADRFLDFRAENVRRDHARYTLGYGVFGRYNLTLDYNKIPHRLGNDATMLFNRTAPGRFEIPAPARAQVQAGAASVADLVTAASRVDLDVQRDRTTARFELNPLGPIAWSLQYDHENRQGLRQYGGGLSFARTIEVPEPIDYRTSSTELRGEWRGSRGALGFGARHSRFENSISTLVWDNPFLATHLPNQAAVGFADLAPDNDSTLFFVQGRGRFGNWWTHGNLAMSRMRQDDPLLPYTLNTALTGAPFDLTDPANLPRGSADGRVDVLNLSAAAGTRFAEDWSFTVRLRHYDYDNRSPRITFPGYVRFHSLWRPIPRVTVPRSYTRQDLRAELGWTPSARHGFQLDYKFETWDREFRETRGSDEHVFGLGWDGRLHPRATVRARYERGDRSIDGEYDVGAQGFSFVDPHVSNHPALRKFLQADRRYDELRLGVDLLPADNVTLSFAIRGREEDYHNSTLGLATDEILGLNIDLGWNPRPGMTVFAFVSREDRERFQRTRQSPPGTAHTPDPANVWEATLDEVTDTLGVGVARAAGPGPWTWEVSLNWSKADGDARFFTLPGGLPPNTVDFDNYSNVELLALRGTLEYAISPRAAAGLVYRFEDYSFDRFSITGLEELMAGGVFMVPDFGDYTAHLVGLHLRFRM